MDFIRVTPESVGIHSKGILAFLDDCARRSVELHGMMLLRRGKVCAEGWWRPYNPMSPHMMFSFTKSLTSTAIGFLRQEGKIELTDKIASFFPDKLPENPSENLLASTVFDLLTMTCGHETEIDWGSPNADPDWVRAFFAQEFKYKPGTCFMYNTAGTNMLCAILKAVTGEDLFAYLTPRLFEPLGIENVECFKMENGVEMGGAGSRLRVEDMARFMWFVAQRGVWDGKQLLSADWFELAGAKQVETLSPTYQPGETDTDWRRGYGFQFWRCTPEKAFRADGAFGQFGIVFEEKDAVLILQTADLRTQNVLDAAWAHLLPALTDEQSLPESTDAHVLLHRLQKAELPALQSPRNPESEKRVHGVRFMPQQTLPGLQDFIGGIWIVAPAGGVTQSLRLEFQKETAQLIAEQDNGAFSVDIGLCGHFALSALSGKTYGGVGHWRGESRFEAEIRCAEAVSGKRFIFDFADGSLTLSVDSTLPAAGGLADDGYAVHRFTRGE